MKSALTILAVIFIIPTGMLSGQVILDDNVIDSRIRTIQFHKESWNLSYPLVSLAGSEKLVLNFDLIGEAQETFWYKIIHCNRDWQESGLFINDFMDGFPENEIEDIKSSFNTTQLYTHYRLTIPNEKVSLKLSGNYILYVYNIEAPEKPVLTRRFIISDNPGAIDVDVHRPLSTASNNSDQQVDFTVNIGGMNLIDPFRNVFATVIQNGKWMSAKSNIKPDVYGGNELKYNSLSSTNIFKGGNEFRYFDIRSTKYLSEFVKNIGFSDQVYHFLLAPSENREFKPYFYWQDFNGKYYVAIQNGRDHDTEADYAEVYFTLPADYMLTGGEMYVSGLLSDWKFSNMNRMAYNSAKRQYECTMLLKQGWYNYEYVWLKNGDKVGTASKFEGSHYETENDYIIIIYYRAPGARYDRVIASEIFNTLNKISR